MQKGIKRLEMENIANTGIDDNRVNKEVAEDSHRRFKFSLTEYS